MAEQFANLAQTVLSASIDDTTPTIPVVNGGAPLPAQAQFRVIVDGEIMLVTAGAGTSSWTVTRGAEGTPRTSHGAGASVTHVLTAGALQGVLDAKANQADLNTTQAELDTALTNTAAISELASTVYANNTESVQQTDYVLIAPFALEVVACSMVFSASLTGDATNRWRFDLNRIRNVNGTPVFTTIASKSNWGGDGAGGASIQPNLDWNFDGQIFNAANQQFLKGDVVVVTHVPIGAPPTFTRRNITARWEPL